jgi:RimJ/RimL family protein N-acetyltransferase
MTRVVVRKLRHWKLADAPALREADNICFPSEPSFRNDESYRWWVAGDKDTTALMGYASLRVVGRTLDNGSKFQTAHFARCGVLPRFRGMGLQTRLISARVAWCKRSGINRIETYTHIDNAHSIANLHKSGFEAKDEGEYRIFWLDLPRVD